MIQSCRLRYRFLYWSLPQNRGEIPTLQRILICVAQQLCFSPVLWLLKPYILRFQFVKIPQFVILLGYSLFYRVIRYTTEITITTIQNEFEQYLLGFIKAANKKRIEREPLYRESSLVNFLNELGICNDWIKNSLTPGTKMIGCEASLLLVLFSYLFPSILAGNEA